MNKKQLDSKTVTPRRASNKTNPLNWITTKKVWHSGVARGAVWTYIPGRRPWGRNNSLCS